nr:MAG TPA: hypothetical protein [Caudoviricetes sp.]
MTVKATFINFIEICGRIYNEETVYSTWITPGVFSWEKLWKITNRNHMMRKKK